MAIALLTRNLGFIFLSVLTLSCSPTMPAAETKPAPTTSTVRVPPNAMNDNILYYVNEHRRSLGLQKLEVLNTAAVQAYLHSKDMATGKTGFGHSGFDRRISNIMQAEGRISASAENVAYGELTAKEVVKGWLNSPGHKRNIEGNYALTGIGTYKDKEGVVFFTQIFLRK